MTLQARCQLGDARSSRAAALCAERIRTHGLRQLRTAMPLAAQH